MVKLMFIMSLLTMNCSNQNDLINNLSINRPDLQVICQPILADGREGFIV